MKNKNLICNLKNILITACSMLEKSSSTVLRFVCKIHCFLCMLHKYFHPSLPRLKWLEEPMWTSLSSLPQVWVFTVTHVLNSMAYIPYWYATCFWSIVSAHGVQHFVICSSERSKFKDAWWLKDAVKHRYLGCRNTVGILLWIFPRLLIYCSC